MGTQGLHWKHTDEHKQRRSDWMKGNTHGTGNKGRIIPEEVREKIRKKVKQNYIDRPELIEIIKEKRKHQKSVYESKHEKLVQNELKKHNISFKKHKYMKEIKHGYQCDIFIEPDLVVEIDGEYWHSLPGRKEMDETRSLELADAGFKILRFDALSIMDKNYKINQIALDELISFIKYEIR